MVFLIDEATSALDATSRILVFEALKRWRMNKTTIVITHDLSQIESTDFVYVLKDGRVVEQGFRYDLESVSEERDDCRGEFRKMMEQQNQTGSFLPEQEVYSEDHSLDVEDVLRQHEEGEDTATPRNVKPSLCDHLCQLKVGCSTSLPILPLQN